MWIDGEPESLPVRMHDVLPRPSGCWGRPVVGSPFVAGGFVVPALFGSEIIFEANAAPQPNPLDLTVEQIDRLEYPDFRETWPMTELIAGMDAVEEEYGYLVGDFNTDGLLNVAYHLYGQQMFIDVYENPERIRRLLDMIGQVIVDVALYVRERTAAENRPGER